MQDQLTICPRCTSNACYNIENNKHQTYFCYGCGYFSDSTKIKDSKTLEQFKETLPELYKSLEYYDPETGLLFFPSVINIPTKGMVFVDGTGPLDWKWAAVLAIPIEKSEKKKFPKGQTHKMDMTTIHHFDEKDFMEALEYIGYFSE